VRTDRAARHFTERTAAVICRTRFVYGRRPLLNCSRTIAVSAWLLCAAAPLAAQTDSTSMKSMPGMNMSGGATNGSWAHLPNQSNIDMSMAIPMPKGMPMMPGLMGLRPKTTDWFPGAGVNVATLPEAIPSKTIELKNGDTLNLEAKMVKRTIAGKSILMYGYNGMYPGPLIKVKQNSTITVKFK